MHMCFIICLMSFKFYKSIYDVAKTFSILSFAENDSAAVEIIR